MRILFIPINRYNLKSNEHIPNRIRMLSQKHEVLGVELKGQPFIGVETPKGLAKSLYYGLKVFSFGLRRRKDYDLIFCWEPFYSIVGLCIALLCGKPCIRDSCIVTRYHYLQMRTFKAKVTTIIASITEKTLFKCLKMMIVLSEADKKAYIEMGFKSDKVVVIPLPAGFQFSDEVTAGKDVLRRKLGHEKDKKILIFTGIRDYLPNMRAACWINDELAPAISSKFGDAQILFTGSGAIPKQVHPIAIFTGFVPNYFEHLQAADIVIAPLQPKSGVLVKILDAMSCSKPMIIMTEAAAGFPELIDGYNVMIAKDMVEFIEKALYLLEHPEEAKQMGVKARETMERYYAPKIWEEKLSEVLEECLIKDK